MVNICPYEFNKKLWLWREKAAALKDEADPYIRGLIATEVYKNNPQMPVVLKCAVITSRSLSEIEPIVLTEETILGPVSRQMQVHGGLSEADAWRKIVHYPENKHIDYDLPIPSDIKETLSWWNDNVFDMQSETAKSAKWLTESTIFGNLMGSSNGHSLPDISILLKNGIDDLIDRINIRREKTLTNKQADQLYAMEIILMGLKQMALNYAAKARETAGNTNDIILKQNLLKAASDIEYVSYKKPATLSQAIQLTYLGNMTDKYGNCGDAYSFGRIDQYLYPFYKADLDAGIINSQQAFDMICALVIKSFKVQSSCNMTLAGLSPEGIDATNELSYMFLWAMIKTELPTDITCRIHKNTPISFKRLSVAAMRMNFGRPSLINDDVVIPGLTASGIDIEDARDYAIIGCAELMIPGRTTGRTMVLAYNPSRLIELMLNSGKCTITGKKYINDVPESYDNYKHFEMHYYKQAEKCLRLALDCVRENEKLVSMYQPKPWLTVLSHNGIEDAQDYTEGQPKYDPVGCTILGIADAVNSLYSMKKLEQLGMSDINNITNMIKNNWTDHEYLQGYILHRISKYGQDDMEVNKITRKLTSHYSEILLSEKTAFGGVFHPMIFGVSEALKGHRGAKTGATPSGRAAMQPIPNSLQPQPGTITGITELLNSITAIDLKGYPGGISNVQELDPNLFDGEKGITILISILDAYFEKGGLEIALNFLDENTLRDAQVHPENYSFLMVRLFGMSARFINLDADVQRGIIERARESQKHRSVL